MKHLNQIVAAIAYIATTFLFTACGGESFTDPRDGQKYKTVKIGDQVWMAENLKYKAENSDCPENDPEMCEKFGALYGATYLYLHDKDPIKGMLWKFIDAKIPLDACPDGWRLPTENDFEILYSYVDSVSQKKIGLGKALKSKHGWEEGKEGVDLVGFGATPNSKSQRVTYLAIPLTPPIGSDGFEIDGSVNVMPSKVNLRPSKVNTKIHEHSVLESFTSTASSIRCIKSDSLFENNLQRNLSIIVNSVVESVEKSLNDSLNLTYGPWNEQRPYILTTSGIYYKIKMESEGLSLLKTHIENKIAINKCPANSIWTFRISRLGEDNVFLSKYKCELTLPENEACKNLISSEVMKKYNNENCINLTPFAQKIGEHYKENKRLNVLLGGKN